MDDNQKAAYINAMVVCAFAEIEGMKAANREHHLTIPLPYQQEDFDKISDKYGIHPNALISFFHGH